VVGQQIVQLHAAKPYTKENLDADLNGAVTINDAEFSLDVLLGFAGFISMPDVTSSEATNDCLLAINVTICAADGGPLKSNSVAVYFDLALPSADMQADFNLMFGTSYVTKPGLHGGIVTANRLADSVWGVSVGSQISAPGIGLSVILIGKDDTSIVTHFLGGLRASSTFVYDSKLSVALDIQGTNVPISTSGDLGYNPLTTFANLNNALDCRLNQCNLTVGCPSDQYLSTDCNCDGKPCAASALKPI